MASVEELHAQTMTAHEWVRGVSRLYDLDSVPELDTQHVLWGLWLIDESALGDVSVDPESIEDMITDGSRPIDELLTVDGRRALMDRETPLSDVLPTLSDEPAQEDELGRKAFARVVAKRLRRMQEGRRAGHGKVPFRLHLHAPWGAGKTSLLNFLRDELGRPSELDGIRTEAWITVDFNAWLHQRVAPPWWWMMNSVYRQGASQLLHQSPLSGMWLVISEHRWRLRRGKGPQVMALLVLAGFFFLFTPLRRAVIEGSFGDLASSAQALNGVIALLLTAWAAALASSRFLLLRSAGAAGSFLETAKDPMRDVTTHFCWLVKRLKRPVVVFIDDLDRCDSAYVVQLLEGIQTLFYEAPVTYVVAADRRWLNASFEQAYEPFQNDVREPGRPLGYLFLEKTFQLSVSVPRLSAGRQGEYWGSLLRYRMNGAHAYSDDSRSDEAERRVRMREELGKMTTDAEVERARSHSVDPLFAEEAILRLEDQDLEINTQKNLEPFAHLIDPYPRAMKRLVNSYSMQRAIDFLSSDEDTIDPGVLALWTILNLRWPLLAEYLESNPATTAHVGHDSATIGVVDDRVRALFIDEAVRDVITGKDVSAQLDESAIRRCARLRTSQASTTGVA